MLKYFTFARLNAPNFFIFYPTVSKETVFRIGLLGKENKMH